MKAVPNLDDPRRAILDAALPNAGFDGWTPSLLRDAVRQVGLPQGAEELYFPGGPLELIAYWGEVCDAAVWDALAKHDLGSMKIREKVTAGVLARLEAMGSYDSAARRALARMALPDGLTTGPKVLWQASDTIWRAIGDTSTDANFYSKRATLSAVISSTLLAWFNDSTPEKTEARAFLDRRIENVMQFEKVKAKARTLTDTLPDPVRFFSDLRYGRRSRYRRRG